jgi:HAD superfamily hydrolase (TIGR01450 family)
MNEQVRQAVEGRHHDKARVHSAQRILCDIDGCLISGSRALNGACAFVERFSDRLALVSNNSTDTKASLQARLESLGMPLRPDQFFLAGEEALAWAAAHFGAGPMFLLANTRMRTAAADKSLFHCHREPRAVIICRDTDLTLKRLEMALLHIAKGCPVILANDDITHPGDTGPAIESGALLRLLETCHTPSQIIRIGKPKPDLLLKALGHVDARHAVMIGDNPSTDALAARRAGIPPILVGSAVERWLDDLV